MITVEKPTEEKLKTLQVTSWPIWECEPSVFDWHYDEQETCYILQGKVTVEAAGKTVNFAQGDLVTFPQGLSCRWIVHEKVKKHYRFG
ncbi:MAG TPA: cupin domain-containing protein [Bacillota bacterium]|nr:cupin domain-containing protein [Bacillota bacterium]